MTLLYHIDMIDDCRVEREDSFDADPETGLAHGNRLAHPAMFAGDTDALEGLQALFGFRLFNTYVNTNGVAGLKLRNVIA